MLGAKLVEAWRQTLHTMALENQALTPDAADRLLAGLIDDAVAQAVKAEFHKHDGLREVNRALVEAERARHYGPTDPDGHYCRACEAAARRTS